jgi:hypothetical protein
MKHSLIKILELFYNYFIGSLCKYPTTSYNNNNDNNEIIIIIITIIH